jgi:hypothetical protein
LGKPGLQSLAILQFPGSLTSGARASALTPAVRLRRRHHHLFRDAVGRLLVRIAWRRNGQLRLQQPGRTGMRRGPREIGSGMKPSRCCAVFGRTLRQTYMIAATSRRWCHRRPTEV